MTARARWVIGGVALVLVLGTVPLVLDVPDVTDTMDRGRVAAQRGLAAARAAATPSTAELEFRRAAVEFDEARDQLGSAKYQAGRLVPGVAPNLRAARALADIGYDLASNGVGVTSAVDPEALDGGGRDAPDRRGAAHHALARPGRRHPGALARPPA